MQVKLNTSRVQNLALSDDNARAYAFFIVIGRQHEPRGAQENVGDGGHVSVATCGTLCRNDANNKSTRLPARVNQ